MQKSENMIILLAAFTAICPVLCEGGYHPDSFKLERIQDKPDTNYWSDQEMELYEKGQVICKTAIYEKPLWGEGIGMIKVHAPADKIWNIITDYPRYPEFMEKIESAEVYEEKLKTKNDLKIISVKYNAGFIFIDICYHVRHYIHKDDYFLTWELDKSQKNDYADTVGCWLVLPEGENVCRVYYQAKVEAGRWIPGFIMKWLTKSSLVEILESVKTEAEKSQK